MHGLRHHQFDLEAYFELELESATKFEFCDGAILAMAGGTLQHSRLAGNAYAALRARIGKTCEAFNSDQRVATGDGVHTYPDAMVVCGPAQTTQHRGTETVHNPSVIVEVLSPSTRAYDLGEKLDHYKTTPGLQDVLFVEAESIDVLHVWRTEAGWEQRRFTSPTASVPIRALGRRLPVLELYVGAQV